MNTGLRKKTKVVFNGIFVFLIIVWFILSVYSGIYIIVNDQIDTTWSASDMYPSVNKKNNKKASKVSAVKAFVKHKEEQIGNKTKDDNEFFDQVIDLKKVCDRYLYGYNVTTALVGTKNNPDSITDVVVVHGDGYLSEIVDQSNLEENYEKFSKMANSIINDGRDFVLLIPPIKDGALASSYMNVYTDCSVETKDLLIKRCREDGIHTLTLDDDLGVADGNWDEYFFKSDHHWLPQTGMIASKQLAGWLNSRDIT